jgi:hypothetical protein
VNKINEDFIVRFFKKKVEYINKNDLISLIEIEGDFNDVAELYLKHGILNSITIDLLTEKASDKQVKLILEGSLPLPPDQSPFIVFFVLKSYKSLIKELYYFINNGGKYLKKQLVNTDIFKGKYLKYLVKLLKNDEDFVTELIASRKYDIEHINILVRSESGEVLFKISKLRDILFQNPDLVEELLKNPYLPDDAIIDLKQMIYEIKNLINKEPEKEREDENNKDNICDNLNKEELEDIKTKVKSLALFQKEEDEIEEELTKNLFVEIVNMSMPEKMKLALKGNKTARMLLIKDSNKQISLAVLKNPGITDDEIYQILKNRTTGEHIIRNIARQRILMKDYNIMKSIVMHPKTPVEISIRLLNRLYVNDLGVVAKSRDIPSNLRTAALRMYELKNKKKL